MEWLADDLISSGGQFISWRNYGKELHTIFWSRNWTFRWWRNNLVVLEGKSTTLNI